MRVAFDAVWRPSPRESGAPASLQTLPINLLLHIAIGVFAYTRCLHGLTCVTSLPCVHARHDLQICYEHTHHCERRLPVAGMQPAKLPPQCTYTLPRPNFCIAFCFNTY